MRVPAPGKDQRRAVFGALDYGLGEVTWQLHPKKGGDAFAAMLAQIAQLWPDDQVVLVLDNVIYHRSPVVGAWWAEQEGQITPLWLPVSTPNLNLMERVWRFLFQKLACHRFWADVDGLEQATATLLDQLESLFTPTNRPAYAWSKASAKLLSVQRTYRGFLQFSRYDTIQDHGLESDSHSPSTDQEPLPSHRITRGSDVALSSGQKGNRCGSESC